MNKRLLCFMASLLLCGAVSAQHFTAPDAHAKSGNTPIVAAVTVDNAAPATGAELAVYIEDTLRGLATTTLDGKYWVQAFYNSGTTKNITFKLWNPAGEGAELDTYTLTYGDLTALTTCEEGYGTPSNPVELNFQTVQMMTQTTNLDEWTWWSTPIEMSNVNGLQMLETSLGTNGLIIKGKNNSAVYLSNMNRWVGNCPITNEASYEINVSTPCSIELSGVVANPEDHPITIGNGWNWIGFPVWNQTQTITTALGSDFQPVAGDVVKGQNTSAVYLNSVIGWRPTTFTFSSGNGYMYYSSANTDKTLTFRHTRDSEIEFDHVESHWQANYKKSASNLTLLGIVYVDGEEQRSDNLELGAFISGECRGSAKLLLIEPLDAYYVILTINGEDGDVIDFELFNSEDGSVNSDNKTYLVFDKNAIIGEPNNPYPIMFSGNSDDVVLKVYPNPVMRNQPYTLSIPSDEIISQVLITDALGNVVSRKVGAELLHQQEGISVSGVYFTKVICKSGRVYYGRIIVE